MTVFIASLFLPYTINFQATELRYARRKSSSSSSQGEGKIVGRLADTNRKRHSKSISLYTPGATTEDEKIFKPYISRSAGEIPAADDPNGPGPSEPRTVSWGQSRKFNQPRSKASLYPEPSILSRPEIDELDNPPYLDAPLDAISSEEEHGSPRALLSEMDWVVKAAEQGNGGLRNAINAAEEAGMLTDKMWVGTLGMPTDSLKDETRASISEALEDEFESLTVFVNDSEFEGHYTHFCRAVLWPAFHYQMQESPRHTEYDDYSWKQYVRVNEAFADKIAAYWRPGDSIWIHDYHLLLLPSMLRERLPNAEIGFFMHTAFPSSEIFRCLNARDALLHGLLGADLVGFQTEEYCYHFLQSCIRLLGLEVSVDGVQLEKRFVNVRNMPIGVDPKALDLLRRSTEVKDWIANISSRYKGKHLIVARDRLDAPGGIKHKLMAYELFLKQYPKWRDKVVLVQIASASELPELEAQVSKIAMRINSVYSSLTHQPLVFLRQDISYSQFLALMSVAEIFMVTSLREGMNLSSHDYIHCQDGILTGQRHGSLILSEFTGSASIFNGHELMVNPWDYKEVADTINRAFEMTAEQKQRNWEFLLEKMTPHTALAWFNSFQASLTKAHSAQLSRELSQVKPLSLDAVKGAYDESTVRLFFLEIEGIVASSHGGPANLVPLLQRLLEDPKNLVYVTSSKSPEQLEILLEPLSTKVGIIAENGCFVRQIGNSDWVTLVDMEKAKDWRNGIRKVIQYYHERVEGSVMEEGRCLLNFWYHDALDPEAAARQASGLADQINGTRGSEAIRVVLTEGAVSVEPLDMTKAKAADSVLQHLDQIPDFLFVAGGARGDEALFRWANRLQTDEKNPSVTTLTVGTHATEARAVPPEGLGIVDIVDALVFSLPEGHLDGHSDGLAADAPAPVQAEQGEDEQTNGHAPATPPPVFSGHEANGYSTPPMSPTPDWHLVEHSPTLNGVNGATHPL
ncbi:trehalose-6-phosphate synthase [Aspergillus aculeatinus CBS 121060]|uniref:Alpha,alpha-trehalose phosphate synthase subunit n=1 Tax=Aspergillus aculeatinus CBS 121060 TaxID=1448322 RepID=A0ACD1HNV9_9EURO|nr:alpha,alpha-trehalose phosphate synthase subunit [Aspergillus aculeatinus CBS 121060]RAH75137.1 alpha,alpha-trehalose phosphate synthase subunit [Aspergillus aculeatinus CBS 121060]